MLDGYERFVVVPSGPAHTKPAPAWLQPTKPGTAAGAYSGLSGLESGHQRMRSLLFVSSK